MTFTEPLCGVCKHKFRIAETMSRGGQICFLAFCMNCDRRVEFPLLSGDRTPRGWVPQTMALAGLNYLDVRRNLIWRDGRLCHYCHARTLYAFEVAKLSSNLRDSVIDGPYGPDKFGSLSMTIDHKIPSVKGGSDDITNLVIACARCNASKGSIDYEWYQVYERNIEPRRQLADWGRNALETLKR
jgi:5-methylcytosine-specific restriction endonuclease McrA